MILEMKVPSPGESISEVEIAEWLVETGDYVEKDQAIAEVDSDKATLELPAEVSGTIEILYEPGDVVGVGEVVCKIDTSADAPAKGDKPIKETLPSSEKIDITPLKESYATGSPSPAAKKILDEKGILASSIQGTGKDGRITKDDAINAKASMGSSIGKERTQNRERMSSLQIGRAHVRTPVTSLSRMPSSA